MYLIILWIIDSLMHNVLNVRRAASWSTVTACGTSTCVIDCRAHPMSIVLGCLNGGWRLNMKICSIQPFRTTAKENSCNSKFMQILYMDSYPVQYLYIKQQARHTFTSVALVNDPYVVLAHNPSHNPVKHHCTKSVPNRPQWSQLFSWSMRTILPSPESARQQVLPTRDSVDCGQNPWCSNESKSAE